MKTLSELIDAVAPLEARDLERWIETGWVTATWTETEWRFSTADEARVRLICDLRYEMAIDTETIPLVLDLLDQLYATRRQLKALAAAVETQPEAVREAIRQALADPPPR